MTVRAHRARDDAYAEAIAINVPYRAARHGVRSDRVTVSATVTTAAMLVAFTAAPFATVQAAPDRIDARAQRGDYENDVPRSVAIDERTIRLLAELDAQLVLDAVPATPEPRLT